MMPQSLSSRPFIISSDQKIEIKLLSGPLDEAKICADGQDDISAKYETVVNIQKMNKFVENFANKSGTMLHPNREITDFLVIGLAKNIDETGKQLCPCMFFEDKEEEIRKKSWICPCEEMQRWKYCH